MKINYADSKEQIINFSFNKKLYDFIIIGSGPAAITLYKKILSKKTNKPKILIIEEGDYYKKNFKKIISKYLKINLKSRAFTVGGTSSIWSNISSYFEDFEMKPRWEKKKFNLWPLNHKSLLDEYKKLDKKYQFFFKKLKKNFIDIPFEIRPFIATTRPINFKQLININEIDLIYNCKIKSIDENKKEATAYSIDNKFKFNAKKIIVCCGGIESVKLIQDSLSEKKLKNIKNKKLVGKYFMDHPKFDLGYLRYPKVDIISQIELTKKDDFITYYGISLQKNIQEKKNLLNSYVRFEKPNIKISRFLDTLNIPIISNILRSKKIFRVKLFCEMMPNINNSIISKKNKTLAMLRLSKVDSETIKLLANEIKYFFSFKPEKETNFNFKNIINRAKDASHHMGGLRYNPNKKLSVVDKNLRILGLQKIYICSSAIFPTSGSVNPTMTVCALSNKLGVHLRKYS
tara:strand:+ start:4694 stop:6070 length:1377 start_codon:yes stop_codon:yes gene_type:complete